MAGSLLDAGSGILEHPDVHRDEHSLEMQMPFLQRLVSDLRIVPAMMGGQSRHEVDSLAEAVLHPLGPEVLRARARRRIGCLRWRGRGVRRGCRGRFGGAPRRCPGRGSRRLGKAAAGAQAQLDQFRRQAVVAQEPLAVAGDAGAFHEGGGRRIGFVRRHRRCGHQGRQADDDRCLAHSVFPADRIAKR